MTLETLEQCRGIVTEIRSLDAVIKAVYDTRKSPNGKTSAGCSSEPSAPTERAAMLAQELNEKRDALEQEADRARREIEDWLGTITDPEARSIIRWHYMLGHSWKITNEKVYGYPSYYRARKKIMRMFGKN